MTLLIYAGSGANECRVGCFACRSDRRDQIIASDYFFGGGGVVRNFATEFWLKKIEKKP